MPLPPPEPQLESLAEACRAVAEGDQAKADALAASLKADLPRPSRHLAIPPSLQVEVLRRDRSSCRYCGARLVPPPVMRAVALVWPGYVPYQPHWRTDSTHPLFAARTATLDHVLPIAHGGAALTSENLVTACWACNLQKSEFTLERIGWTLREPDVSSDWDGLTHAYPALWERAKHQATPSQSRYHMRWLRLLTS